MNEPSDTPRTDAAQISCDPVEGTVNASFARTLERELAGCRKTCDELVTDSSAVTLAQSLHRMEQQLAAKSAECERLKDALVKIASGECRSLVDGNNQIFCEWIEVAKEALKLPS